MEESRKVMNIEEVDKILALEEVPPSKGLAYFMWAVILFFWIYGGAMIAISIASVWDIITTIFSGISETLLKYSPIIIGGLAVLFLLMLVSAILYLKILHKIARELLHVFYIGLGLILLLLGGAVVVIGGSDALVGGVILLVIGLGVLLLYAVFRQRIDLAGRMIEVSAKAVNDEKGAILAVIIKAIVVFWTSITWAITLYTGIAYTYLATLGMSESTQNAILAVVSIVLLFLGIWSLYYLDLFFNAVIVRIIHDWYRSPQVDVASLKKGLAKAFEVSGSLAKFAIVYATLYLLIQMARSYAAKGKGAGRIAAAIVARILDITEDVIRFLGFYAVPAIVIRKAGFKDAFKDSIHKLRDLFIETLAGSFAFGLVTGFIAFLSASLIGGLGFLLGYLVFSPLFNLTNYALIIGVASGVAFFIIAMIPIGFATTAVSIAWKTMLYEYGLDIEFAMKGIYLPSRLPEDLKAKFSEILAQKGISVPTPAATA